MSTFAKQCPKCYKIYKYMESIPPHCKTCTKWGMPVELNVIPTPKDVRLVMGSHAKYCPKCGDYYKYDESKRDTCKICGTELKEAEFTNEDVWYGRGAAKNFSAWRKAVIETDPLFDKSAEDKRLKDAAFYDSVQNEMGSPKCPKCGSRDFQMVARKWSPLTGFLTNKVDRVCTRCKRRF